MNERSSKLIGGRIHNKLPHSDLFGVKDRQGGCLRSGARSDDGVPLLLGRFGVVGCCTSLLYSGRLYRSGQGGSISSEAASARSSWKTSRSFLASAYSGLLWTRGLASMRL